MSLNYPNREKWLAVRATPRKLPPRRWLHVSRPLVLVRNELTGVFEWRLSPGKGRTYRKPK